MGCWPREPSPFVDLVDTGQTGVGSQLQHPLRLLHEGAGPGGVHHGQRFGHVDLRRAELYAEALQRFQQAMGNGFVGEIPDGGAGLGIHTGLGIQMEGQPVIDAPQLAIGGAHLAAEARVRQLEEELRRLRGE